MDTKTNTYWFPSKVDRWVKALLVLAPVAAFFGIFHYTALMLDLPNVIAIAVGLSVIYVFVFPMRYGISADQLIIRCGLVRLRLGLEKILLVQPSRSLTGAPALSLDRLKISSTPGTNFDKLVISPADREGFLTMLAQRSGLSRRGDYLARL